MHPLRIGICECLPSFSYYWDQLEGMQLIIFSTHRAILPSPVFFELQHIPIPETDHALIHRAKCHAFLDIQQDQNDSFSFLLLNEWEDFSFQTRVMYLERWNTGMPTIDEIIKTMHERITNNFYTQAQLENWINTMSL